VKKVVTVTNEKNQMKLTVEELQKQFSILLFNDMLLVCHETNKDNHQLEIDYCLSLNTKIDPCTLISDQNEASSGDSDRSSSSLSVADSSGSFSTSSVSSEIRVVDRQCIMYLTGSSLTEWCKSINSINK
jgi:hypothetical protein